MTAAEACDHTVVTGAGRTWVCTRDAHSSRHHPASADGPDRHVMVRADGETW